MSIRTINKYSESLSSSLSTVAILGFSTDTMTDSPSPLSLFSPSLSIPSFAFSEIVF